MKNFNGKILFLDRSDINTDEIIPAKYLTELTKAALKPYCLEDLNLPGFDPKKDIAGRSVIVTRANFGCPLGAGVQRHQPGDRGELRPDLPAEHVQLRPDGDFARRRGDR